MATQKRAASQVSKRSTIKKSAPARKPVARKSQKKSTSTSSRTSQPITPIGTASTKNQGLSAINFRNPRLWVGVGVVILVVLAYVYKGLFIAALVNGQPISRFAVISQLEKQNGKQAIGNLVVESLVEQEAQKRHITVSQSDIDAQISKIEDQLKGQGVTLDDALSARGLTRSDLVDQIKLQSYLDKMVGTSVKVSDADVQSYIDKNQSSLPQGLSDADLHAQVLQQLQQQGLQDKTQAFVADLQKKAKVTYFVNY